MGARHLRYVSEMRIGSKLTDEQDQLCRRAEGWAHDVPTVTALIRQTILGHRLKW